MTRREFCKGLGVLVLVPWMPSVLDGFVANGNAADSIQARLDRGEMVVLPPGEIYLDKTLYFRKQGACLRELAPGQTLIRSAGNPIIEVSSKVPEEWRHEVYRNFNLIWCTWA